MAKIPLFMSKAGDKPDIDFFYEQLSSLPGSLKIAADAPAPEIVLIDYDETSSTRKSVAMPEECIPFLDTQSVSWIDVQGLGNENILQRLGRAFKLHPLLLEDIVNVPQRPKVEEYDSQMVIIARMVTPKEKGAGFHSEQVSFVFGKHYLLTVQEEPERDCFESVRVRISTNKGLIRKHGVDYLVYTLLDALIDGFFPVLESYSERIEDLEDEAVVNPTRQTLKKIYQVKRELLALRRAIWPQRDAINILIRDSNTLVSDEVRVYLRDSYDHAIQVLDMVETYRELAAGLMDVYLSAVSNKMNEVMKLLTVISTIFIPLTFVVGVYGMNFDPDRSPLNMPELTWYWGYPLCWAVMIAIASGLVFFFWRRGWFENFSTLKQD
ncbi:MAG: magnesium/cobalt transporter CorA [Chroococcidiopsidaceae cyanobacterium CP_BM_ER_R8_30]|nr:magnesium/cobalt transporter CorA [Chroococcidiopsidaceae cyanobacterium CP_BM_ER_R8_30]